MVEGWLMRPDDTENNMVIDYDEGNIAEQYKKTKEFPVRSRIEAYSFLKRKRIPIESTKVYGIAVRGLSMPTAQQMTQ